MPDSVLVSLTSILSQHDHAEWSFGEDHMLRALETKEIPLFFDVKGIDCLDLGSSKFYVKDTVTPSPNRTKVLFQAAAKPANKGYTNVTVIAARPHSSIFISVIGSNILAYVGNIGYGFVSEIGLYNNSTVLIGDACTSNGVQITAANSEVIMEQDCMLSHEIVIQSSDQHGIVDLETMKIINNERRRVVIGEHVWLGKRSILLPRASVGAGSMVGAGSTVAGPIPPKAVAAGCPARVIASNKSWTRSFHTILPSELEFFRRAE